LLNAERNQINQPGLSNNGLSTFVFGPNFHEFLQVISINFIFLTLTKNIQEKILFFDRKSTGIARTFSRQEIHRVSFDKNYFEPA